MIAALGERAHDMAAEEARAAEDGDERIGGNCGHSALLGWAPAGSTLICCAPASRELAQLSHGIYVAQDFLR